MKAARLQADLVHYRESYVSLLQRNWPPTWAYTRHSERTKHTNGWSPPHGPHLLPDQIRCNVVTW